MELLKCWITNKEIEGIPVSNSIGLIVNHKNKAKIKGHICTACEAFSSTSAKRKALKYSLWNGYDDCVCQKCGASMPNPKIMLDSKAKPHIDEYNVDDSVLNNHLKKANDNDPMVRSDAVQVLGNEEDPRVTDMLISALKDEAHYVRNHAAKYLGRIRGARVAEALKEALKDSSKTVQKTVAKSLLQFSDESIREFGREFFNQHSESKETRTSGLEIFYHGFKPFSGILAIIGTFVVRYSWEFFEPGKGSGQGQDSPAFYGLLLGAGLIAQWFFMLEVKRDILKKQRLGK